MSGIYTMAQWERDGTFKAEKAQPISSDVYETFYNQLPPQHLPRATFPVSISAGFMTTEPYIHAESSGKYRAFYMAFGRNGENCFYLGLYATNGDAYEDARPLPMV